jgi:hypothetical protein
VHTGQNTQKPSSQQAVSSAFVESSPGSHVPDTHILTLAAATIHTYVFLTVGGPGHTRATRRRLALWAARVLAWDGALAGAASFERVALLLLRLGHLLYCQQLARTKVWGVRVLCQTAAHRQMEQAAVPSQTMDTQSAGVCLRVLQ